MENDTVEKTKKNKYDFVDNKLSFYQANNEKTKKVARVLQKSFRR